MKYERERKASSLSTARESLNAFRAEFGHRPIGSITPIEAEDWANSVPRSRCRRLSRCSTTRSTTASSRTTRSRASAEAGRGRADTDAPTVKQFEALLTGCDALGDYAPQMRALVIVAAYTGMRPSELYELRWTDIDLAANRIIVSRRGYRGGVGLTPPARDVLMRQPPRTGELVLRSKVGKRLTASTVCQYWALVKARAGLEFDFYLATKHYGVHLLYKLGLSKRAIAAQMGWSENAVDGLLRTYGHSDLVALAEVDALYSETAMHDPSETAL